MPNSQTGCRGLPSTKITLALVAQGTEQLPSKQLVVGSNPTERVETVRLLACMNTLHCWAIWAWSVHRDRDFSLILSSSPASRTSVMLPNAIASIFCCRKIRSTNSSVDLCINQFLSLGHEIRFRHHHHNQPVQPKRILPRGDLDKLPLTIAIKCE